MHGWSKSDLNHVVMRLSGYNAAQTLPCWKALDHLMRYLFHKPHIPITFSNEKVMESKINAHHAKGYAEITSLKNIREQIGLKAYSDVDLRKDMATRRLVTSVVHEYNEFVFVWTIVKQTSKYSFTYKMEIFSLESREL